MTQSLGAVIEDGQVEAVVVAHQDLVVLGRACNGVQGSAAMLAFTAILAEWNL